LSPPGFKKETKMSITLAEVRAYVRQKTRRDNEAEFTDTQLDAMVLESCREISKRLLCLKTDTTGTLSGDGTSITPPTDMVKSDSAIIELYLGSKLQDRITFAEWRAGYVRGFCYHDGLIYVNPTSDNDRSYTLYYAAMHGALSTNLEFEDDLKMAVVWLTCKKVFDDYLADASDVVRSQKAEREYEREIDQNAPVEVVVSRMRATRE
jgi:hypothetical protein